MHDFLRSVGFSTIDKSEYQKVLQNVLDEPTEVFMSPCSMKSAFGGMAKEYAQSMGIMAFGEFTPEADLEAEFYFPYLKGRRVTSSEYVTVEKQPDKNSYMGVCDEMNLGVSVIFQLLNMKDYMEYSLKHEKILGKRPITLSGLSVSGKIILPILKSGHKNVSPKPESSHRNQMLAAARQGDQDAIESLTLEDIDLYTEVSRRARSEDILSIVESYFMPYGIAYDQYSIMGNILAVDTLKNEATGDHIYRMCLDCNDFVFDVCINQKDLYGEPAPGRRFRGNIWLQGIIDFSDTGMDV